ncbi:hypothetical protein CDAR_182991 [Caerostris darwini]|uniref:Uncharacterized protein n=1 Tax=Caerostris darwini TaxID=1538125 RepID=A0AAV4T1Y0_9ARAC|nr:hypothetical protein CDAR_182991 [Caerostris darwini]
MQIQNCIKKPNDAESKICSTVLIGFVESETPQTLQSFTFLPQMKMMSLPLEVVIEFRSCTFFSKSTKIEWFVKLGTFRTSRATVVAKFEIQNNPHEKCNEPYPTPKQLIRLFADDFLSKEGGITRMECVDNVFF